MCVYSLVMDHYSPKIDDWYERLHQEPKPLPALTIPPLADATLMTEIRDLLKRVAEALDAAKKVDDLTGQPDCERAEKEQMLQRIAELEAIVNAPVQPEYEYAIRVDGRYWVAASQGPMRYYMTSKENRSIWNRRNLAIRWMKLCRESELEVSEEHRRTFKLVRITRKCA